MNHSGLVVHVWLLGKGVFSELVLTSSRSRTEDNLREEGSCGGGGGGGEGGGEGGGLLGGGVDGGGGGGCGSVA